MASSRFPDIIASYAETQNCAETGRRFGLSGERVRQIVTCAGDGDLAGGYPLRFKLAVAEIALREGIGPVSRITGIARHSLRNWTYALFGGTHRPAGRPTSKAAQKRDRRIRYALRALVADGGL